MEAYCCFRSIYFNFMYKSRYGKERKKKKGSFEIKYKLDDTSSVSDSILN